MKNRAFTVFELLIIIAIIAILAAFLLPVLAKARQRSNLIDCASNEHQIGMAMLEYVQDYDDVYPMGMSSYAKTPYTFRFEISPYIRNKKLFVCPSNLDPSKDFQGYSMDYAVNGWNKLFTSDLGMSSASIQRPARKIMLCEHRTNKDAYCYACSWWGLNDPAFANQGFAGHLSRMNCTFMDGHVVSLKPSQTITPFNMWDYTNDKPEPALVMGMKALSSQFKG
jgi:prepilin-type processing-associated H-X9-DG protein